MVILQHPFVFCSGQIGELKEDVVGITTLEAFKSLVVASISVNPAGKQHHLFLFLSFCSITVVLIIPPLLLSSTLPPPPSHIQFYPTPVSLPAGLLYIFLDDPSPSWQLSTTTWPLPPQDPITLIAYRFSNE